MMKMSYWVVMGLTMLAVGLSGLYFRRYQVTRPPIGVFTLEDIVIMFMLIVIIPLLYITLPMGIVVVIVLVTVANILYFTLEPVLHARWLLWVVMLMTLGADIIVALSADPLSESYLTVNNGLLVISVVGISNLWAQSGMKAWHITLLALLLFGYDFVATSVFTIMADLFVRFSELPFSPMIAWGGGENALGIGLGDLLMIATFPLVMRRAYGPTASWVAMIMGIGTAGMLLLLPFEGVIPAMVFLCPVILTQYGFWRWKHGEERTTWRYLHEDPPGNRVSSV